MKHCYCTLLYLYCLPLSPITKLSLVASHAFHNYNWLPFYITEDGQITEPFIVHFVNTLWTVVLVNIAIHMYYMHAYVKLCSSMIHVHKWCVYSTTYLHSHMLFVGWLLYCKHTYLSANPMPHSRHIYFLSDFKHVCTM